jgi:hypothetical protein
VSTYDGSEGRSCAAETGHLRDSEVHSCFHLQEERSDELGLCIGLTIVNIIMRALKLLYGDIS